MTMGRVFANLPPRGAVVFVAAIVSPKHVETGGEEAGRVDLR
jgi:hypothetical protein